MVEKEGRKFIVGTVSGGGWRCSSESDKEGFAAPWGPNDDILDQRWNSVSAHVDWISNVIKGSKAKMCQPK